MGINKMNSSHMVELLLDFGADINVQDRQGNTSLMLAAIVEQWNACKLIIEKGNPDFSIRNNKGETALYLAWGNPFIERLMIEAGAQ
jgi:ankyrin repeat protein